MEKAKVHHYAFGIVGIALGVALGTLLANKLQEMMNKARVAPPAASASATS